MQVIVDGVAHKSVKCSTVGTKKQKSEIIDPRHVGFSSLFSPFLSLPLPPRGPPFLLSSLLSPQPVSQVPPLPFLDPWTHYWRVSGHVILSDHRPFYPHLCARFLNRFFFGPGLFSAMHLSDRHRCRCRSGAELQRNERKPLKVFSCIFLFGPRCG